MEKKPIGVIIIGWLIIVSSAMLLWDSVVVFFSLQLILSTSALFLVKNFSPFPFLASKIIDIISSTILDKTSLDILWCISFSIFCLINIAFGIGILKLKNIARIIIIAISTISIIKSLSNLFNWVGVGNIVNTSLAVGSVLASLIYILYLTHPKVKEQFK